jgi:uncharacterized protein YraI
LSAAGNCLAAQKAGNTGLGIGPIPIYEQGNERGQTMHRSILPVILTFMLVASCSNLAAERTVVEGTGPVDLLKLRAGPGLGFRVILGLPEGTSVNRRDCVTEVGQLWCRVSLTDAPQITGYVSADYLSPR